MYTNSSLIEYTKISPHRSTRTSVIKKITIHHAAGNCSIETIGNVFQSRRASANYGIGTDGRIAMYVEEKDRAWTSSNSANDNQAVTIEVANSSGEPNWKVSDKALESLINLCVDICKRNGIEKLNYTGNKNGNLTMHKWFAATACPGPYLEGKFPWIAEQVNKRLGVVEEKIDEKEEVKSSTSKTLYRVRKTWKDAKSQIGAYSSLSNAKKVCDEAGNEYHVFDANGNAIYPITENQATFYEGDVVKLIVGAKYTTGQSVPNWVINSKLYARDIQGDNIVISTKSSGAITGVVNKKYLIKVSSGTINVGDTIKLSTGAKYTNGKSVPAWVIAKTLYAREFQGNNIVISTLKTGAITGVVSKDYVRKA